MQPQHNTQTDPNADMRVSDFEFSLPAELIAKYPSKERSASRLLHLRRNSGKLSHNQFTDILQLLDDKDLMIFNDTRVIPARLYGRKSSGGRVEILVERVLDPTTVTAQIRSSKTPRTGARIHLEGGHAQAATVEILGREAAGRAAFFKIGFPAPGAMAILEQMGHVPLPPYIGRPSEDLDADRYQTVYAQHDGAVAAPTAGLHFDQTLLDRIDAKGVDRGFVTLHVGAGTFQPIRVDRIEDHRMHSEYAIVPTAVCEKIAACRKRSGRVIAVGTTSARCLETASLHGKIKPFEGETDLFIYPGFKFRCVDALLTNFHLPGSTLILLVSAFAGIDNLKHAYQAAIADSYRFFSYGDAMFIG
jgi:S-adenosylmethionine:tRNA ribosyltransferase-isomerase|tara:strand:- start:9617 stop:10699 length:1083 start_codon:yes stop_codon:yes gene_type:complete